MNNIEIFETNVSSEKDANVLQGLFGIAFPKLKINFDLWDPQCVLRVQSLQEQIDESIITSYLNKLGFEASQIE
ncbi:MAG: hypothetical protein AAFX87_21290 [Bacteroidota bacterium]